MNRWFLYFVVATIYANELVGGKLQQCIVPDKKIIAIEQNVCITRNGDYANIEILHSQIDFILNEINRVQSGELTRETRLAAIEATSSVGALFQLTNSPVVGSLNSVLSVLSALHTFFETRELSKSNKIMNKEALKLKKFYDEVIKMTIESIEEQKKSSIELPEQLSSALLAFKAFETKYFEMFKSKEEFEGNLKKAKVKSIACGITIGLNFGTLIFPNLAILGIGSSAFGVVLGAFGLGVEVHKMLTTVLRQSEVQSQKKKLLTLRPLDETQKELIILKSKQLAKETKDNGWELTLSGINMINAVTAIGIGVTGATVGIAVGFGLITIPGVGIAIVAGGCIIGMVAVGVNSAYLVFTKNPDLKKKYRDLKISLTEKINSVSIKEALEGKSINEIASGFHRPDFQLHKRANETDRIREHLHNLYVERDQVLLSLRSDLNPNLSEEERNIKKLSLEKINGKILNVLDYTIKEKDEINGEYAKWVDGLEQKFKNAKDEVEKRKILERLNLYEHKVIPLTELKEKYNEEYINAIVASKFKGFSLADAQELREKYRDLVARKDARDKLEEIMMPINVAMATLLSTDPEQALREFFNIPNFNGNFLPVKNKVVPLDLSGPDEVYDFPPQKSFSAPVVPLNKWTPSPRPDFTPIPNNQDRFIPDYGNK